MGTVTIQTIYPGASAADVELNVTIPIEEALEEVPGIEEMVSESSEGMSSITVTNGNCGQRCRRGIFCGDIQ